MGIPVGHTLLQQPCNRPISEGFLNPIPTISHRGPQIDAGADNGPATSANPAPIPQDTLRKPPSVAGLPSLPTPSPHLAPIRAEKSHSRNLVAFLPDSPPARGHQVVVSHARRRGIPSAKWRPISSRNDPRTDDPAVNPGADEVAPNLLQERPTHRRQPSRVHRERTGAQSPPAVPHARRSSV